MSQRGNGRGLALGDAFCGVLARRLDADIVTAGKTEFASIEALQWASVTPLFDEQNATQKAAIEYSI